MSTSRRRTHATLFVVALVLLLTADDRYVGRIADGRQMIVTAVAMTESDTLGQAAGRDLAIVRRGGDAVSRFGLGMSFAQIPAALMAPAVEARLGAGSSQPLFLIAPFLFVLMCGWLAASIVGRLGGGAAAQGVAVLFATIASPFGSYAALELSESLQALALTAGFFFALRARHEHTRANAALAGACAGLAVLTKSSLLAVAPLTLLPLLPKRGQPPFLRKKGDNRHFSQKKGTAVFGSAAGGFAAVAAVWLYFELIRFGRPMAGYPGEGFTHPFFDGAWRLLVGPNKGLLLYFPAAVIALLGAAFAVRRKAADALTIAAPSLVLLALVGIAAPWWAWHGVDGWGPRLIVPAVPLLASVAALETDRWPRTVLGAFVALSILINMPPLVQHPTPVVRYEWASAWPAVDPSTAASVPAFARHRRDDGATIIPPDQILSSVASASPFRLLPWFFAASRGTPSDVAATLNAPPWLAARPDIRPQPPLSADEAVAMAPPPRFHFLGRGFVDVPPAGSNVYAYDAALQSQILRAQHLRENAHALQLSEKLERIAPSGYADALLLETYRLLGRKQDAIDWLTHLPTTRRLEPAIDIVLALWDRDEGKADEARQLLGAGAAQFPGLPAARALDQPLSQWPSDLASMTADPNVELQLKYP